MSAQFVEDSSARLLHLFDDGRIDLAICRSSISQRPEIYESVEVCDEHLADVASTANPLSALRQLELPMKHKIDFAMGCLLLEPLI